MRAFDEVLRLGEEIVEEDGEDGVGEAEAAGEKIVQGTDNLVGYGGGFMGVARLWQASAYRSSHRPMRLARYRARRVIG